MVISERNERTELAAPYAVAVRETCVWQFDPTGVGHTRANPAYLTISVFLTRQLSFFRMLQKTGLVVTNDAHVTLHYRLRIAEGADIINTFSGNPATLQMGAGQLAPPLEVCLIGLPEGVHRLFDLPPEALGQHNPGLLRWVSRTTLLENSTPDMVYHIGDMIDFAAPGGGQFAGVIRDLNDEAALFDFNHPLAGRALQFEVKIIGIL